MSSSAMSAKNRVLCPSKTITNLWSDEIAINKNVCVKLYSTLKQVYNIPQHLENLEITAYHSL